MAIFKTTRLLSATFFAVALWSSTTAVVIRDDYVAPQLPQEGLTPQGRHHGAWAACEPAVCHEVQTQAEGLDKIKTLRNFVRETLSLLDALVTTLDEELVETGSALRQFVGPRCPTSHSFLDRVSKTAVQVDRSVSNELSGEVRVEPDFPEVGATGSRDQEVVHQGQQRHQQEHTVHHQGQQAGQYHQGEQAGQYHQGEQTGQYHQGQQTGQYHQGGQQTGQYHHEEQTHQQQHHKGHEEFAEHGSIEHSMSTSISSSSISSSSSSKQQKGSHTKSSGGKTLAKHETQSNLQHGSSSTHTSVGGTSGSGSSKSSRVEVQGGVKSGCRGLKKGESPYWVPGLDEWCAVNCAQNYCPKTHCICDMH